MGYYTYMNTSTTTDRFGTSNNRSEATVGIVSRQHAINNDTFEAFPVGQKFEVCNWFGRTLSKVCIKTAPDRVYNVGDGTEWRIDQSDATARHHFFSWR